MTDPDEHTPIPRLLPERVARLEWHHEHQKKDHAAVKNELADVAKELRGVAESVRGLVERKRFFDKLVLGVGTGILLLLIGVVARIATIVQSNKLVP